MKVKRPLSLLTASSLLRSNLSDLATCACHVFAYDRLLQKGGEQVYVEFAREALVDARATLARMSSAVEDAIRDIDRNQPAAPIVDAAYADACRTEREVA